jgi:hypothetical protein
LVVVRESKQNRKDPIQHKIQSKETGSLKNDPIEVRQKCKQETISKYGRMPRKDEANSIWIDQSVARRRTAKKAEEGSQVVGEWRRKHKSHGVRKRSERVSFA